MIIIDPKGNNAAITAARRARAMGHTVNGLNPWGLPSHRFNPLAEIDIRE